MFDGVLHSLTHPTAAQVIGALVLACFVTVIACVRRPRIKALVFSLPVPFTCAYLATDLPVNATHLTGMALTVGYHWLVFALRPRIGLGASIATGALGYLALGAMLRPVAALPTALVGFLLLTAWLVGLLVYRGVDEPGHRGQSPWWLKLPCVAAIAYFVFALVPLLAGAAATFPYAGVFTSYEMRHSLRTLAGQYMINIAAFFMMALVMAAVRHYHLLPVPWELLAGWAAMLGCLAMIYAAGLGRPTVGTGITVVTPDAGNPV